MNWFEKLTGFAETSGDDVRSKLELTGTLLKSLVNGRTLDAGEFSTPDLDSLRQACSLPTGIRKVRVSELVADVQSLHQDPANASAVFQVASQFNCLEMAAPHMVPEDGVGIYENDWTQGPACCLCAGAGTIFRNYFADVNGQIGQTAKHQIDCLAGIGREFDLVSNPLWEMENGYCFPTKDGLSEIENRLGSMNEDELDRVRGKLMVGVQSNTEVTLGASNHQVTQVFCSGLPISYSNVPANEWNHFPRLILDAAYEATFYTAFQNLKNTGCPTLFLTLVGGGVFGNQLDWILSSIGRALEIFTSVDFDVRIVSYGSSKPEIANFVRQQNSAA